MGWAFVSFVLMAAPPGVVRSWEGSVRVDGMIHEPGGYHPYLSTIALRLREGARVTVPGGFRVALVSVGSVNHVRTSVHQTSGLVLCSGTGREIQPDRVIGYVERKGGQPTYHLVLPRAFAAFACGRNNAIKRDRRVVIGAGEPEPAEIETADPVPRTLEHGDSVMQGSFASTRVRGVVRYEYEVSWYLRREPPGGSVAEEKQ